jgi:hypothetical protein
MMGATPTGSGSQATPEAAKASSPSVSIPSAIAEQVLSMGRAEWAATAELTETGHLEHLAESLRLTREHFNFEDVPVRMHGLYLDGTETVLCHTGTSPNSGANAQALAGAWNWLHDQCASAMSARSAETEGLSPQDASAVPLAADAPTSSPTPPEVSV